MPIAPSPIAATYDWRHPDPLTREFELADGATVAGSLRFTNLVGSRAGGAAFGQAWSFRRIGIFRPRIEIRAADASEDSAPDATIALDFSGTGLLTHAGGDTLQWTLAQTAAGERWGWTAAHALLMSFEHSPPDDGMIAALVQTQGRANVTPSGAQRTDAALLLVAGWYLVAAQQFDLVANPPGL